MWLWSRALRGKGRLKSHRVRQSVVVVERDREGESGRRVMICTDSQATMRAMESAWKKGRHTSERVDRKGLVATMVELRRRVSRERQDGQTRGCERMVYTPGHRGIAPNAVADAIAKAYLGAEGDGGVLGEVIQQTVHVRPYVCGVREMNTVGGKVQMIEG